MRHRLPESSPKGLYSGVARFSADQIYAFARAAGFTPDQAVTMTAISLAESGGKSTSHATVGEDSRGLWQINVAAHPDYGQTYDLWDPRQNAEAAYAISDHGQNISPWSTTHRGTAAAYVHFRAEAQAAAVAHGDAPGLGVWTGTTGYGDVEPASHSDPSASAGAPTDPAPTPDPPAADPPTSSDPQASADAPVAGTTTPEASLPPSNVGVPTAAPPASAPPPTPLPDEGHGLILTAVAPADASAALMSERPDDGHGLLLSTPGTATGATAAEGPPAAGSEVLVADAPGTSTATSSSSDNLDAQPAAELQVPSGTDVATTAADEHRVDAFVNAALAERHDAYVFGATVSMIDPHPSAFDCSSLVRWSAHQAGVQVPDGSWLQYLSLKRQGLVIPVDQAIHTKGALLFSFSSAPEAGAGRPSHAHVAISLGNGETIEARGRAYGVNEFQATTARFQYAAVLPGLAEPAAGHTATAPVVAVPDTAPVASGGRVLDTDTSPKTDQLSRRLAMDPHHTDTAPHEIANSVDLVFDGHDPTGGGTTPPSVDAAMDLSHVDHVAAAHPAQAGQPTQHHHVVMIDDHPTHHDSHAGYDVHDDSQDPVHAYSSGHDVDSSHDTGAGGGEHDGHHG
ncbi:hypothetical protein acdb102_22690 [Acidothermaceae bacterium B102]|nr:hypothetical protein acdb102_22690 [Acidothermaceae bacterium B102]